MQGPMLAITAPQLKLLTNAFHLPYARHLPPLACLWSFWLLVGVF